MHAFKINTRTFFSISIFIVITLHIDPRHKKETLQALQETGSLTDTVQTPFTFLALGDSYTIGESVPRLENFPNQTVSILRTKKIAAADPDIIATTGWTTTDLINAISKDPPQRIYAVVTLLIGVNNQYQGKSLVEYKNEFIMLLNNAIKFAGERKTNVYVLSIPDYSVTPFATHLDTSGIAGELNAFNEINKNISVQTGVNYIDITGISKLAKSDPSLTAPDGLHPSAIQYRKWAELLAEKILH